MKNFILFSLLTLVLLGSVKVLAGTVPSQIQQWQSQNGISSGRYDLSLLSLKTGQKKTFDISFQQIKNHQAQNVWLQVCKVGRLMGHMTIEVNYEAGLKPGGPVVRRPVLMLQTTSQKLPDLLPHCF